MVKSSKISLTTLRLASRRGPILTQSGLTHTNIVLSATNDTGIPYAAVCPVQPAVRLCGLVSWPLAVNFDFLLAYSPEVNEPDTVWFIVNAGVANTILTSTKRLFIALT
jgi:hypothetical protein